MSEQAQQNAQQAQQAGEQAQENAEQAQQAGEQAQENAEQAQQAGEQATQPPRRGVLGNFGGLESMKELSCKPSGSSSYRAPLHSKWDWSKGVE